MVIFSNNAVDFCKNIDILPEIIVEIIYSYIPNSVTMFLTKKTYIEYHHFIRQYINKKKIEQYIRTMVHADNDFVFMHLLVENYSRWINMKKYYYQECIYGNYLKFLESYAIDNHSVKCLNIICKILKEQAFSKNQHKKNTNKYIRWRI
jgi:hypothetical protein